MTLHDLWLNDGLDEAWGDGHVDDGWCDCTDCADERYWEHRIDAYMEDHS